MTRSLLNHRKSPSPEQESSSNGYGTNSESVSLLEPFSSPSVSKVPYPESPSLSQGSVKLTPPVSAIELSKDRLRWFILSLSCFLLFGNYFAYDNPAALNTQLQKYLGMDYNDYQYLLSTLYSVYSLPNTILPFYFGHLVDRLGPQRVLIILSACVCIGQGLFAMGVQTRQIWLMLVGRAVFGIGGESCSVAQASITTAFFRGHELAFALGLNLCIARCGSVVNAIVTPWVEQLWGVPTAIWVGTLSCVLSFLCAVMLITLIRLSDEHSARVHPSSCSYTPLIESDQDGFSALEPFYIESVVLTPEISSPAIIPDSPVILPRLQHLRRDDSLSSTSVHSVRFQPGHSESGTPPSLYIVTTDPPPSGEGSAEPYWWEHWVQDLKYFPTTFWLICSLTVLLYGTVVPFNNIASDFLQSKWYPGNPRKAAAVMGIPDTIGAILVPLFGTIIDRYGGRATSLISSAAIMVVVHSTLGFTNLTPVFGFSLLGVAYSVYGVALWPSIACVVTNELYLGKAYGISASFLNISLTLVPPIVATIRVWGESFEPVEIFFIGMGLVGILAGMTLKYIDHRDGGPLENPEIRIEVPVVAPTSFTAAATSTRNDVVKGKTATMTTTSPSSRQSSIRSSPTITLDQQQHLLQQPAVVTTRRNLHRLPRLYPLQTNIAINSPVMSALWPDLASETEGKQQLLSEPPPSIPSAPPTDSTILPFSADHTPFLSGTTSIRRKKFRSPIFDSVYLPDGPSTRQQSTSPSSSQNTALQGKVIQPLGIGHKSYGSFATAPTLPPRASYSKAPTESGCGGVDQDHPGHNTTQGEEEEEEEEEEEVGELQYTVDQDAYGVKQHPILYNPLRGSTGSFRIHRSLNRISFGDGEEGQVFVDGQQVHGLGPGNFVEDHDHVTNNDKDEEEEEEEGEDDDDIGGDGVNEQGRVQTS